MRTLTLLREMAAAWAKRSFCPSLLTGLAVGVAWLAAGATGLGQEKQATSPAIAIRFHLQTPSRLTLVIEDEHGNRVRNLLAEVALPGGEQTVYWDGYDDGTRNNRGELIRRRRSWRTSACFGARKDGRCSVCTGVTRTLS